MPLWEDFCNALTQPHFDYTCQTWFPNLTKALSNKCSVYFVWTRIIRVHLETKEFKDYNWLPINERENQCICVGVYNFFNNTSPSYMSDIFMPSNETHPKFHVPLRKTNMGQNALSFTGPNLWNSLPIDVKLAKNRNVFKHKMKSNYFDSL